MKCNPGLLLPVLWLILLTPISLHKVFTGQRKKKKKNWPEDKSWINNWIALKQKQVSFIPMILVVLTSPFPPPLLCNHTHSIKLCLYSCPNLALVNVLMFAKIKQTKRNKYTFIKKQLGSQKLFVCNQWFIFPTIFQECCVFPPKRLGFGMELQKLMIKVTALTRRNLTISRTLAGFKKRQTTSCCLT